MMIVTRMVNMHRNLSTLALVGVLASGCGGAAFSSGLLAERDSGDPSGDAGELDAPLEGEALAVDAGADVAQAGAIHDAAADVVDGDLSALDAGDGASCASTTITQGASSCGQLPQGDPLVMPSVYRRDFPLQQACAFTPTPASCSSCSSYTCACVLATPDPCKSGTATGCTEADPATGAALVVTCN